MAFHHAAVTEMRHSLETLRNRVAAAKKHTEQTLKRGATIAFTSGTALTLGYCNERFGSAPADDPSGYKEMTVLKMPVDMVAGGLMTAATLLGAFGKYDHFGLSIGTGAVSAFGYRLGAEFARRHLKQEAAAAPKTSGLGAFGPAQPYAGYQGAADQHFAYAPG